MELTTEEKAIAQTMNTIGRAAFSGMIFNASVAHPTEDTDELIKKALAIRVRLSELIE